MRHANWRLVRYLVLFGMTLAALPKAHAQTEVLTRSYDNGRTGANLTEKVLNPQNVRKLGLKRRFRIELNQDDQRVEAQPLYVTGLLMKDGKKHDVLLLFSMGNKAYAFDINTASNIWTTMRGRPFRPDPHDPVDSHYINTSFGVLCTPVVDRDAGLIFWIVDDQGNRQLKVQALKLSDGAIPADHPPLAISGSAVNDNHQTIVLDQVQTQRAALLLTPLRLPQGSAQHKLLYIGFTGADERRRSRERSAPFRPRPKATMAAPGRLSQRSPEAT